uniref:Secreted protein n=1 Tax=Macrostomum lignano TaxID=282301 RepID=A0A1I8FQT6_9PLAT
LLIRLYRVLPVDASTAAGRVNSAEAAPPRPRLRNSNPNLRQLFAASFPLAPLIRAAHQPVRQRYRRAPGCSGTFVVAVAMMWRRTSACGTTSWSFSTLPGVISNAASSRFTASWVKLPQFEEMLNNLPAKLCIVLIVEERYRVPKILNSGNIKTT